MKAAIVMLIMLWMSGCGGSEPARVEAPERREQAPSSGDRAAQQAGVVSIAPEMLRDLRTTTASVESRPGGEGAAILGELGVDESAYAEVGTTVAGRIVSLARSAGDGVRSGETLVEIQSPELGAARSAHTRALARTELARQALERKRALLADRIAPAREVQEAQAELAGAEADLAASEAALDALGVPAEGEGSDPSRLTLSSPIPGTIVSRDAALGRVAHPGDLLFKIADLRKLWLTVHAFERDAVRVRPGAVARITFPAVPGRSFAGPVSLVGRQVDPTSRTVPVRIEMENSEGILRPGMSASAWVPLGDAGGNLIAVPAASLQRLRDEWCVFIPRAEGRFEIRPVGRGRDLGGEVEILTGLTPGEIVVVEGAFLLKAEAEKSGDEGDHHDH